MPIFWSLDPKQFKVYRSCKIDNGTTVYSNHSIPSDCSCVAPIFADPDFAGPGLIASFCFLAWLSVFVASIPAFYNLRAEWQNLKREPNKRRKLLKYMKRIFSTQVHEDNTPNRSSVITVPESTSTFNDVEGKLPLPEVQSPAPDPIPVATAKTLLVSLTDIQVVSGLAVVVSALAQLNRISFYHSQHAINLWWLTLNSVWVARLDFNEDSPENSSIRIQVRRLSIFASVVASVVLQIWSAVREKKNWDPLNGRRCYVGSDFGSDFGQDIFWAAGAILYGLVIAAGIFKVTRRWTDKHVFEKIPASLSYLSQRRRDARERLRSSPQNRTITNYLRLATRTLALIVWWFVVQFLSIWSAGNTSYLLELIVYTVFAGSNTWWLIALKVNNVNLVQGNESRWTLGQSFPIMLTLLVMFAGLDAVKLHWP